ncbi:MAG: hypothetical protein NT005_02950 [Spirochaetes bacterium]|nr:hypothetical protein [Spirochaetota bacterium]
MWPGVSLRTPRWNPEQVEEFENKPKLTHMLEAVDRWVPHSRRVHDPEVGDMAERMIREGAEKELY